MKSYQYILLDWDGNLAKTLDVWMDATHLPLQKRGIYISDNQVAVQCFGRPHEGYAELGIKDIDTAIEEMDARAKELLPSVELYPDAIFALEELRRLNKKIALITSSIRENVVPALDTYNLHHFFDVIVTKEDTARHKPDPEPLERALELLDGSKDQAVMIGDSDKDIEAAKNTGVDSILFFPEEHKKFYTVQDMQALQPTYLIDDFREVVSIVS